MTVNLNTSHQQKFITIIITKYKEEHKTKSKRRNKGKNKNQTNDDINKVKKKEERGTEIQK
jgi:hypothetical protein